MDKFEKAVLELLWRSWVSLGVSGVAPKIGLEVDPEALILLTSVAALDARLYDEALDWCVQNHRLVSGTRLKNLAKDFGNAVKDRSSAFNHLVNDNSTARWPIFGESQATGARQRRGKFSPSGKSRLPSVLREVACTRLRLRTIFGVGARSEILTVFATQPSSTFTVLDLTKTGFSKRNIAVTLEELAWGGALVVRKQGNRLVYHLANDDFLKALSIASPLPTLDWIGLGRAVASLGPTKEMPARAAAVEAHAAVVRFLGVVSAAGPVEDVTEYLHKVPKRYAT